MKPTDTAVTSQRIAQLRLLQGHRIHAVPRPPQTPARVGPTLPRHPDERLATAISAAWWSGHEAAESKHYTAGWRFGVRLGAFLGLAVGLPAGMAAVVFARQLLALVLPAVGL